MKLLEVKKALESVKEVKFQLPNGKMVPSHFHLTELGLLTRNFIDCGNTVREEKKVNFQLWEERDFEHRLAPTKLIGIIDSSMSILNLENLDVEVEYQEGTIGKYALDFENGVFILKNTLTACLAEDACGVPPKEEQSSCCAPESSCC